MRIAPKRVEEGKRLRGRGEGVGRKRSGEKRDIHFQKYLDRGEFQKKAWSLERKGFSFIC